MELLRRKNVSTSFDVPLIDSANRPNFKVAATLAAGDIKISKDGGAVSNITSLPTEIGSAGVYRVSLTASEMNATTVAVIFKDVVGGEWDPQAVTIYTTVLDEVHFAKASLVNKREHTIATGVDVIKDDDGSTTLRTLTPSESNGVVTVTPS